MRRPVNPVLVLVIALPLLAVAGSLASLALAVTRGDRELPKNYHWEGGALDREQQRLGLAARLGIGATLSFDAAGQRCTITLHGAAPPTLRLRLTHPTDSGADRGLTLARAGALYTCACDRPAGSALVAGTRGRPGAMAAARAPERRPAAGGAAGRRAARGSGGALNAAGAHLHWQLEGGLEQVEFFAEGMHCANCARSIRTQVGALPGVQQVEVNLTTARVTVAWDPRRSRLRAVLEAVERLGFHPVPLNGAAGSEAQSAERRRSLKRIGLAGLAAMQMSMYTVGLYAGALSGIDPWIERLLRVTAMLIAVPVMFYSGAPFLRGAWHDLRRRSLGMDVPVATALLLAFFASVYNTWRGSGAIYFDSVAMFIFFLLVGRHVEMNVRRGSLNAGEALVRSLPATVTRLHADGGSERVALAAVCAGDRLVVPLGAVIPVDCSLESAATLVDESLITGEALPVIRPSGAQLPGGAINLGAACTVRARSDARHSTLASMAALIERAQATRPPQALAADRAASHFVFWIVLLAAAVAGIWLWLDPARAFGATLAVLVVTCPCALSLATPVALAAATTRLARRGVLVTRADALERLATVDTVVLDKTGTLTSARMQVSEVRCLGNADRGHSLALAASLEQHSVHPLAAAFTAATSARLAVADARECTGRGVEGSVDGVIWRIGRADYVAELTAAALPHDAAGDDDDEFIWLGSSRGVAASFALTDALRPDALAAIESLRALGLSIYIASGDRRSTVARVAAELGIAEATGRMDPRDKLALLSDCAAAGPPRADDRRWHQRRPGAGGRPRVLRHGRRGGAGARRCRPAADERITPLGGRGDRHCPQQLGAGALQPALGTGLQPVRGAARRGRTGLALAGGAGHVRQLAVRGRACTAFREAPGMSIALLLIPLGLLLLVAAVGAFFWAVNQRPVRGPRPCRRRRHWLTTRPPAALPKEPR